MEEKTKNYSNAPLPFMGQKRRFIKYYKQALNECFRDVNTVVDLFGGSGLLSHVTKRMWPHVRVIYNDYDHYDLRIANIANTNLILKELREVLSGYATDKLITSTLKNKVLSILKSYEAKGYVDYITLSSSLLFSMHYATSLKELSKMSLYNCIRKNNYQNANEYLDGLEIVHSDYRLLYNTFNGDDKVLFVIDPPYLSTNCSVYNNYWKLSDYLDVLNILPATNYIYFTSNKSSIIELCRWLDGHNFSNPFNAATIKVVHQKLGINNTAYQDIMLYKRAALKDNFNAA